MIGWLESESNDVASDSVECKKTSKTIIFGRNKRRKKLFSKRNMNKNFWDGGIFVGRSGQVKQT